MRPRSLPRSLVTLAVALAAFATADAADSHPASVPAPEATCTGSQHRGRPQLKLDRLEFPKDVPHGWYYRKQLRQILRREARRADWGAGRGSTISYRFFVKSLFISNEGDVLRVRCTAVGKLPKGKTAKSQLSFGGDPRKRNAVVTQVLEIVARGVITRLAEMERVRRGDRQRSSVRRPVSGG